MFSPRLAFLNNVEGTCQLMAKGQNAAGRFLQCMFGDPHDPRSNLVDVLTDLMHLAAREAELGLEFDSSLKMAQFHFEAEAEECLDT